MKITEHFTLEEMITSTTAAQKGIDNTPNTTIQRRLQALCCNLLEPLRKAWAAPIIVTSGYRSPALNKAVGGAPTSVHQIGYAADIRPQNRAETAAFKAFVLKWLREKNVNYDQYIDEETWVHLGLKNNAGLQRRQNKRCRGGKYTEIK